MKQPVRCSKAAFSPYAKLSMIPSAALKADLESAFRRWGLPQRIKIDNGYPFKPIRSKELPSLSMLWWIGLGIDATLNNLGSPQENGTVEGLQQITYRWANPASFSNVDQLQKALSKICRQQRETYRIRAKGDKTRLELYPDLEQNPRKYSPQMFDLEKVKQYMARFVFIRKTGSSGVVSIAGTKINVGRNHANPFLSVTYNPDKDIWQVKSAEGKLIRESILPSITEKKILNFIPLSKNV